MKIMKIVLIIIFPLICVNLYAKPIAQSLIGDNYQREILSYINSYRVEQGLPSLRMNKMINDVATHHSEMMAKKLIPFGHIGFEQRMRKIFSVFNEHHAIAENVAYCYMDAKSIVNLWLGSSGHRQNIVGDYNLTGIGYAYDEDGMVYVTQIFGSLDELKCNQGKNQE